MRGEGGGEEKAPDPNRAKPALRLEAPPGVEVQTEALWIPLENEMVWRLGGREPGSYELRLIDDSGFETTKSLVVSDRVVRRSPIKVNSGDWLGQIAYPAETPVPADGPIEKIELAYPEADVELLRLEDPLADRVRAAHHRVRLRIPRAVGRHVLRVVTLE